MKEHKSSRTEITIETHRVMRIKTIATTESFCGDCRENVIPILGWQAARAIGTSEEHIELLRLEGEIHKIEAAGICSASLARYLDRETRSGSGQT
jgi:hypothetical protein